MLLPKQIWKDIPGFEGKYQVNQVGQVRSLNYNRTGKVRRLSPGLITNGYLQVGLYKDSKCKLYLVHRLVAQTFIPNPNNYSEVNHKDENKANNTVWNLEWCCRNYNMNYGTRNKRVSEVHRKPIIMLDMNNNILACFYSLQDASEYVGKPRDNDNVGACARGRKKTAFGYKWAYIDIITL